MHYAELNSHYADTPPPAPPAATPPLDAAITPFSRRHAAFTPIFRYY
jgi:hypothetical protein